MAMDATMNPRSQYAGRVAPLCWISVALEGFDLVVLGVVLPSLLKKRRRRQSMFVAGALPALVLVPLLLKYLPESDAFLRVRAGLGARTAGKARKNPIGILFHHGLARSTLAFWVTSFMGLLLVYGLNTWLPQIMREAGYELGAALALLLVLNVGAVVGLLIAGRVSDRIGNRRSTIAWFAGAALFLALLSIRLPGIGVYVSVLLAGMFVFSSQVLVYAYISHLYPAAARATAVGAASGFGRLGGISGPIIGGALLTTGLAYPWGFYIFAVVAAIGAVSISLVNRDPAPDEPLAVTENEADHYGEHTPRRRA
jgi:predicted MFS family arabinose efflux permease